MVLQKLIQVSLTQKEQKVLIAKQIINEINPFGIDLSSGVEKELGIKDNHIINNFIEKLKNA